MNKATLPIRGRKSRIFGIDKHCTGCRERLQFKGSHFVCDHLFCDYCVGFVRQRPKAVQRSIIAIMKQKLAEQARIEHALKTETREAIILPVQPASAAG